MMRSLLLRLLVTALAVSCGSYIIYSSSRTPGLPFNLTVMDSGTALVSPLGEVPLPAGLRAGDRVDLAALDPTARIAADQSTTLMSGTQPAGQNYDFILLRDGARLKVSVTAIEIGANRGSVWVEWLTRCLAALTAVIGLLAVWRGRDRAAAGLATWTLAQMVANSVGHLPAVGGPAMATVLVPDLMFLCARVGFYVMAVAMIGPTLRGRTRLVFHTAFAALLLLGALQRPGAALIYAATGWAELLRPGYGLLLTLSYLPPVVMLAFAYRHADLDQRLRLRRMLWGSVAFLSGILLVDTAPIGAFASQLTGSACTCSPS